LCCSPDQLSYLHLGVLARFSGCRAFAFPDTVQECPSTRFCPRCKPCKRKIPFLSFVFLMKPSPVLPHVSLFTFRSRNPLHKARHRPRNQSVPRLCRQLPSASFAWSRRRFGSKKPPRNFFLPFLSRTLHFYVFPVGSV